MSQNKGLHDGHRDRVRKRFVDEGLDKFLDHQIIEMLLFYGIPRKDTNDIAHCLLNRFGSFSGVFDAPLETIQECGITYNAAVLIKMIPELCSRYYQDKYQHKSKPSEQSHDNNENVEELIMPYFIGKNDEQLLLLLLDNKGKQLFCGVINKGTTSASDVNVIKILQLSVQHKASGVILAHNHPSGLYLPSDKDISMTIKLKEALKAIGVLLLDHYIIADLKCHSMACDEKYEDVFF